MGNCQATDTAAVLLQHPGGQVESFYFPTSAGEVMRSNPGYYVALVTVTLPDESGGPRITRVRLLRAKDTLMLGQVYRLVTSEVVIKGLRARKQEKLRVLEEAKRRENNHQQRQSAGEDEISDVRNGDGSVDALKMSLQDSKQERHQPKTVAQSAIRVRHWRPSLQSISEMAN